MRLRGEDGAKSLKVRGLHPFHLWWCIPGNRTLSGTVLRSVAETSWSQAYDKSSYSEGISLPTSRTAALVNIKVFFEHNRSSNCGLKIGASSISWYYISPRTVGISKVRCVCVVRDGVEGLGEEV